MRFVLNFSDGVKLDCIVRVVENSSDSKVYALNLPGDEEIEIVRFSIDNDNLPAIQSVSNNLNQPRSEVEKALESIPAVISEAIADGVDFTEEDFLNVGPTIPYEPDDIRVEPKNFSLKQIIDMIDDGDLDLSPDFQRNFVWDETRQSRLIESILLRIPIPVFYFSMDNDGLMHVVDGVQRLTTIKSFMSGGFALKDLEYLKAFNGLRYTKDKQERAESGIYLDDKYSRRINSTQISVNVIDPKSPTDVKYDIFRRINTGGRPLNAQEMRNCLMGKDLRTTLRTMAESEDFLSATGKSLNTTRMHAQEMCLRFMSFLALYERDKSFDNYSGQMDQWLDMAAEEFSKTPKSILTKYTESLGRALRNAEYLFGRHAFRKVHTDTVQKSYKNPINKALFIGWSVVLSGIPEETIRNIFRKGEMVEILGREIDNDIYLNKYLSYGTNGWKNMNYTLNKVIHLLDRVNS